MRDCLRQLFSGLHAESLHLAKGECLFRQGDAVVGFYYVERGKIKLIRDTVEGGQALIYVALPGQTLAEASLFFDHYHCSAVADAESDVIVYRKSALLAYLEQHPAAMKDFLQLFAAQVRDLRAINEIKNIRAASERILAYIRHGMNGRQELRLTMSLKDLAYQLGLAHETLYRELKKLEEAKRLMRQDGYIKLL